MTFSIPATFIAKKPLQAVNFDTQVANCSLWLPNGNCNSNTLYFMPTFTPRGWTGVSGLTELNPSGFDGVGGITHADTPLTSANVGNYSTTGTRVLGTLDVTDRNFNNCNCNSGFSAGQYNCLSNCNCNCNCANCNCGK